MKRLTQTDFLPKHQTLKPFVKLVNDDDFSRVLNYDRELNYGRELLYSITIVAKGIQ